MMPIKHVRVTDFDSAARRLLQTGKIRLMLSVKDFLYAFLEILACISSIIAAKLADVMMGGTSNIGTSAGKAAGVMEETGGTVADGIGIWEA